MTLQQIAYIKANFKGLKMIKSLTWMYTNKDWATVFEIELLLTTELEPLMDYIKKEGLIAFIGRRGRIHIQ